MTLPWIKFRRSELKLEELNSGELRLLIHLAQHVAPNNVLNTTYNVLAGGCGFTRRYAIRCLKSLESKGYIERMSQPGKNVAIWLTRGFSHSGIDAPIPVPEGWHSQGEFSL